MANYICSFGTFSYCEEKSAQATRQQNVNSVVSTMSENGIS